MSSLDKKALFEGDLDLDFIKKVHAIPGGDAIKRCIQCGTCSGSCPVSWGMDESPRKIISMVRAGMRDKVLNSSTIWTCASCYSCTVRCPQEIKITDVMYILKRLAIRDSRRRARPAQIFSKTFTNLVTKYGRNQETQLMGRYMLASNPFGIFKYMGAGIKLTLTGRMPLSPSRSKTSRACARLSPRRSNSEVKHEVHLLSRLLGPRRRPRI